MDHSDTEGPLPGDELVNETVHTAPRRTNDEDEDELDHSTVHTDGTEDMARRMRPQGLQSRSPRRQEPPPPPHRLQQKSPVPSGNTEVADGTINDTTSPYQEPGAYSVPQRTIGALPAWAQRRRQQAGGAAGMPQQLPLVTGQNDQVNNRAAPIDESQRSNASSIPPESRALGGEATVPEPRLSTSLAATVTISNVTTGQQPDATSSNVVPDDPLKNNNSTNRKKYILMAAAVVVTAVIVGVVVGIVVNKSQNETSQPPISSRKDSLQEQLAHFTSDSVVSSTFADPTSPQSLALTWLAEDDPMQVPLLDQATLERRYALACLYFATTGDEWKRDLNFLSEKHVCEWNAPFSAANSNGDDNMRETEGVLCDENRIVTKIDIDDNNLRGSLPEELKALSDLDALVLTRNTRMLGGNTLPLLANVDNVRFYGSLSTLNLAENMLRGSIPSGVYELTSLTELNLYRNGFQEEVSSRLSNLRALESLNLSHNSLEGALVLSGLTNLETLKLEELNQTSLDFGPEIFPLTNLQCLSVSGVRVPLELYMYEGISQLSDLEVLKLERLILTGPSLEPFSALTSLHTLSLRNNFISDTIPESFGLMRELSTLDLSINDLYGTIPSVLAELGNLTYVDLSSNYGLQGSADFLCDSETKVIVECAGVACSCCECA
ncbi:MAG: hypothetical protein SGILL_003337 [Bacillariaceae sp.]